MKSVFLVPHFIINSAPGGKWLASAKRGRDDGGSPFFLTPLPDFVGTPPQGGELIMVLHQSLHIWGANKKTSRGNRRMFLRSEGKHDQSSSNTISHFSNKKNKKNYFFYYCLFTPYFPRFIGR